MEFFLTEPCLARVRTEQNMDALENQFTLLFLSHDTSKPHNPNQNKRMLLCFQTTLIFQGVQHPQQHLELREPHSVCYPAGSSGGFPTPMCFGRKANKDWQTKLSAFWWSLALKNKQNAAPPFTHSPPPHPTPPRNADNVHSYTSLNPSLLFQRALCNPGSMNPAFSLLLGVQLPSSATSAWVQIYRHLLRSLMRALSMSWKGHITVSLTWIKHSCYIYPAGPTFPAQFCSQSLRVKFTEQAVWSTPELENKLQEIQRNSFKQHYLSLPICTQFFFPTAEAEHFLTRS